MKIISASDLTFPIIQDFITPYEYSCVTLASHIRKRDEHIYIILFNDSEPILENIFGVIFYDKTLLYCLPFCDESNFLAPDCRPAQRPPQNLFEEDGATAEGRKAGWMNELRPELLKILKTSTIKCINGEKAGSDFILELIKDENIVPYQSNFYNLMILTESPNLPPEQLSCDDEIRRCYDGDFDALFELQKKYIIKEVAPIGKQVSDLECSASLRQILRNQLCFALFSDGEVVSKANTNAIGYNWVQIGGVFTHPLYRKNYYAWNLVRSVCLRVMKSERNVCLFVKTKNNPAHQLYSRMGFIDKGNFVISYFNK